MSRTILNVLTFGSAVVGVTVACSMKHDGATVDAAPFDGVRNDAPSDTGAAASSDLQRVRTADTDLAQLESGFTLFVDRVQLAAGPFVLTDAFCTSGFDNATANLFISSTADCATSMGNVAKVGGSVSLVGARIFVKAGNYLCMGGASVSWSGYHPYQTP